MTELRIHHFFDIIRDYGSGMSLVEHEYGHSYHIIGNKVFDNEIDNIRLIIKNDDICANCEHLISGKCVDTIQHRTDITSKEEFNDLIDSRIMNSMGYADGQVVKVTDLIKNAVRYLDNIFEIYEGNDLDHTEMRKKNVYAGVRKKSRELTG